MVYATDIHQNKIKSVIAACVAGNIAGSGYRGGNNMLKDAISKKDIAAYSRVYEGLVEIKDKTARHIIAGIISAPEFDIGV